MTNIVKNYSYNQYPNSIGTFTSTSLPKAISDAFVGFDKMFEKLSSFDSGSTYPPFNVIKVSDDVFEIQLAVAGFDKKNLTVTEDNGTLLISGDAAGKNDAEDARYVYRGIGARKFTKRFALAEHMYVKDTWYINGILSVLVYRNIPESHKPKTFEIK